MTTASSPGRQAAVHLDAVIVGTVRQPERFRATPTLAAGGHNCANVLKVVYRPQISDKLTTAPAATERLCQWGTACMSQAPQIGSRINVTAR